jgi:hypothetical protein
MALNDDLRDLKIRHHVGVQRLSTQVLRALLAILDRSDVEIFDQLLQRGRR